MSKETPDYRNPFWVRGYYSEVVENAAGQLATETAFRDEFARNIEIVLLEGEYWIGTIEIGRNPSKSYYPGSHEAMRSENEPKTPCHQMPTRPCLDLGNDPHETYRMYVCPMGECNRYQLG